MIEFVGKLLKHGLCLTEDKDLHIKRAHRALEPVLKEGAPLRSTIIKFLSYRTKEEILNSVAEKGLYVEKLTNQCRQ